MQLKLPTLFVTVLMFTRILVACIATTDERKLAIYCAAFLAIREYLRRLAIGLQITNARMFACNLQASIGSLYLSILEKLVMLA